MVSLADRIASEPSEDGSVQSSVPQMPQRNESIIDGVPPHLLGGITVPATVIAPPAVTKNDEVVETATPAELTAALQKYLIHDGIRPEIATIITAEDFEELRVATKRISTKIWSHRKKGEPITMLQALEVKEPKPKKVTPEKVKEKDYAAQIAVLAAESKKQADAITQIVGILAQAANQNGGLVFRK